MLLWLPCPAHRMPGPQLPALPGSSYPPTSLPLSLCPATPAFLETGLQAQPRMLGLAWVWSLGLLPCVRSTDPRHLAWDPDPSGVPLPWRGHTPPAIRTFVVVESTVKTNQCIYQEAQDS